VFNIVKNALEDIKNIYIWYLIWETLDNTKGW
jgi:hypothetical protein